MVSAKEAKLWELLPGAVKLKIPVQFFFHFIVAVVVDLRIHFSSYYYYKMFSLFFWLGSSHLYGPASMEHESICMFGEHKNII
jgi:hypothetical protein